MFFTRHRHRHRRHRRRYRHHHCHRHRHRHSHYLINQMHFSTVRIVFAVIEMTFNKIIRQ